MAQYPSNAPTLTGAGEAIGSFSLRGAVAVRTTEFAVLLLRASAVTLLLSPVLAVGLLLTG